MGVFRETSIEWGGKTYKFVPTMKLLHSIEAGDPAQDIAPISIARLTNDALTGNPQIAKMSFVVQKIMHAAGATDFSDEEFYQEMTVGDRLAAVACWHQVIAALSPAPKEGKKAAARNKK